MAKNVAAMIKKLRPCRDAEEWANMFTNPQEAWEACERGDWMLWLIAKLSGEPESDERRKLVGCATEVAEQALPIYEKRYPTDSRPRNCIEAAMQWSRKEITTDQLRVKRYAAAAAADAAADAADAADAAAYAAYAAADVAAYAAYAAYAADAAAADVAAYAAYAAYAADAAAADVAADAAAYARASNLKKSAEIVRKHYPIAPEVNNGR